MAELSQGGRVQGAEIVNEVLSSQEVVSRV